jgi:2-octaprenyl-6-methoxyphenol hydroxylase
MTSDFDIAICGAGPVGLCLAALLVKYGAAPARIALIDGKTLQQAVHDPRSIALSYGSRQILQTVGAWPLPATPIHQIHVSRRGHFGRALIDRADYDLPALGYVSRYGALVAALAQAVERAGIVPIRPARIVASNESAEQVELQLADRPGITTPLLVQAEGGLFSDQGTRAQHRDYRQIALIAEVAVSMPAAQRAFERFTDEGPLALLPQQDPQSAAAGGYALVWCVRPEHAERLMQLDDAAFLTQLGNAFGTRLGRFVKISRRNAYPLGLNAQPAVSARSVAIGNAAQTLHPVAGQGLNLGLRDAAVLARLLAPPAAPDVLRQFAQARQADRRITIGITDTMARIFSSAPDGALSQSVLGAGLGLIDIINPARKLLAEQMMFGRR